MFLPPLDALADGLAMLDATDRLTAPNLAMRELLAAAGAAGIPAPNAADLAALGVTAAQRTALVDGEAVTLRLGSRTFRLRAVASGADRWLIASETTAREAATTAALAHARAGRLAAIAAVIVHDLSNLLGSGLGLAGLLRPLASDDGERELLDDLTSGTRQGAALARSLAKLLGAGGRPQRLAPAELVRALLAVVGKPAATAKVALTADVADDLPAGFGDEAEAVQALLEAALFALGAGARRLAVGAEAVRFGDGERSRPGVRIALVANDLAAGSAAAARRATCVDDGWTLRDLRTGGGEGLFAAVMVLRRRGGRLDVTGDDAELRFVYTWPAAGVGPAAE